MVAQAVDFGPALLLSIHISSPTPFTVPVPLPDTTAGADARLEGVNRPELLPQEYSNVIDVAGFLTPSEVRRGARCS